MKHVITVFLTLAAALAAPALGGEGPGEDETLPRPVKGQKPEYYAALAGVHAAFGFFAMAETLQLKAIEVEKERAKKERLSFDLFSRIYCRAKWWDKAAKEILRTIELVDKDNVHQKRKYHLDRARVLKEAKNTDEHIKELHTVVALSETEAEKTRALRILLTALKAAGKLQAKIDEYEARVRKSPRDKVTLRILAEIYCGGGLLDLPGKAIRKYEQIRQSDPDDLHASERLARLYASTEQKQKSVAMFERLMTLHPKRFKMYFDAATAVLRRLGEKGEALAWCEKIWRRYPKQALVPVRIGDLYRSRGRRPKAAEHYRKAIDLTDQYMDKLPLYFRLIDCQTAARQYPEAERSCREALKLRIRSSDLRQRLKDLLNQILELQGKPREE